MRPFPAASPDPLANYLLPARGATGGETERRLALAWASLAARRDPAANARRVTVLPPVGYLSN